MKFNTATKDTIVLILAGVIFYIPFLGGVHLFDWDEVNFAEVSREMIELGDYFRIHVNYEPFWEKPPLFFWLQAGSMQIFGVNEFAARFPNAIAGILTLVLLYRIGRKTADRSLGLCWSLAWFGSVLPHLYMKSGIIDPWFNLFMLLGTWGIVRSVWHAERHAGYKGSPLKAAASGGFWIGLAVLTKGPVGLLIPGLTIAIYLFATRFRHVNKWPWGFTWLGVAVLTCGLWFGPEIIMHGTWFTGEFLEYQVRLFQTEDAGHGGFPGYHFAVALFGVFPASLFAISALYKNQTIDSTSSDFRLWMIILLLVVLVLFSIVQSKIVHYSSMAWFPVTWLAALEMRAIIEKKSKWTGAIQWSLVAISLLWIGACFVLVWAGTHPSKIEAIANDPFFIQRIASPVQWHFIDVWPAVILLLTVPVAVYFFRNEKTVRGLLVLYVGTAIFVQAGLINYIARIEEYTQGPAIRFYESLQSEIEAGEIYIYVAGYKSFAPYFYTKKPVPENFDPAASEENARQQKNADGTNSFNSSLTSDGTWLIFGEIDRDLWIVSKWNRKNYLEQLPELKLVKSENGFYFFKRNKVVSTPEL